MFPQQVTLSIILLSSLVHNAMVAMENTNENPIRETTLFRTLSWSRTASGTMYYSYPYPDNAKNHPYQGTPAAFETEFRKILSLNMDSHRSRGKSNSFLENYEAKQLQSLKEYRQVIIERQKKF